MNNLPWRRVVALAADKLLDECSPLVFPVDLTRLAIKRGIRQVRFRPMLVDGALENTSEGLEIQIKAKTDKIVPASMLDSAALNVRERFTYAHELCHTFFYDEQTRYSRRRPPSKILEPLCNHGAGLLLLPAFLIRREIGRGRRISSIETILNLAQRARVSPMVAVRRLDEIRELTDQDYVLLVLEFDPDRHLRVKGASMSGSFLAFPRPVLHAEPPEWVSRLAPALLSVDGTAYRVAKDDEWDFVSRSVPNPRRPTQLLAEIRLQQSRINNPRKASAESLSVTKNPRKPL